MYLMASVSKYQSLFTFPLETGVFTKEQTVPFKFLLYRNLLFHQSTIKLSMYLLSQVRLSGSDFMEVCLRLSSPNLSPKLSLLPIPLVFKSICFLIKPYQSVQTATRNSPFSPQKANYVGFFQIDCKSQFQVPLLKIWNRRGYVLCRYFGLYCVFENA